MFVRFMGHGDTKNLMLLPGNMRECFEFGWRAFDIAERMQMPVFVMSDLDLGMNLWISEPLEYPNRPMDRGKILALDSVDALIRAHGGASRLRVEFEKAPEHPEALPGKLDGEKLEVETDDPAALLPRFSELNLGLHDLSLKRPTLETVFLNLTGRSLRDS